MELKDENKLMNECSEYYNIILKKLSHLLLMKI